LSETFAQKTFSKLSFSNQFGQIVIFLSCKISTTDKNTKSNQSSFFISSIHFKISSFFDKENSAFVVSKVQIQAFKFQKSNSL
jgi:hypothetical protein